VVNGAARNLRYYYAGMMAGDVGYEVQSVAVAWHVYGLNHRPFDLGLVGLALFLPSFAFALPAGMVSDRFDRRIVVASMLAVEATSVAGFITAVLLHVKALPVYLSVLAVVGTARAFGVPSERSLLPNIVAKERFLRAQASYSIVRETIRIAGPALGGVLVASSTTFALGGACAMLSASAALLAMLRYTPAARSAGTATFRDALGGLQFLRSQPVVAGAISLDLFAVLFGGATALLPAFADGVFHAGAPGLGLLRSAGGIGAGLAAFALSRRPPERHVGRTLLAAVAVFGGATVAFGLSHSFVLSLGLLAIAGGADMVSVVIRSGLVQLQTPDAMRGRVNAVENVFIGASNELGAFESGTLAALVGAVASVVIGGVATLTCIAVWSVLFPSLRMADRLTADTAS